MSFLSLITKSSQHEHPPDNNPNWILLNIVLHIHTSQQKQEYLIIIHKRHKLILIGNKIVHTRNILFLLQTVRIEETVQKIDNLLYFVVSLYGLGFGGIAMRREWGLIVVGWPGIADDVVDVLKELFEDLLVGVFVFHRFFLASVVDVDIVADT